MAGIFGHLNISDTDRVFQSTVGQAVIYDAVQEYIDRVNADINLALSLFVETTTSDFKERYKLPGGGHLQRRGPDGRYGSVKAYGQWDVAFPLEDFGAQMSSNDVAMAYMTLQELERHLETVTLQNVNTVRFEMLKALLNNAQDTFVDDLHGSLSIEPLANGDTVVYPPVIGAEAEATEDHYLESGYLASAISDTNNPYITIRDDLVHHYGTSVGYNAFVFINSAQEALTDDLTDYTPVSDRFIQEGDDTAQPTGLPAGLPGTVIGRINGVWVVKWEWVPSGYMVGIHGDHKAPLKRRVDPEDTGLGTGLQLVSVDEEFPFQAAFWRNRLGFGAGNRLNGVVMELANGGTYTVPTAYA